jgi:hypothetical protein
VDTLVKPRAYHNVSNISLLVDRIENVTGKKIWYVNKYDPKKPKGAAFIERIYFYVKPKQ